jgi:hypothetical protein
MSLSITSPSFEMNCTIPARFTCDGENISPQLIFSNIPVETKSLALTMEDPDVPRTIKPDGMWNHWVVWNMLPTVAGIGEGSDAPGIVGVNSRGNNKYGGPCPPDREHRYIFTLYALDSTLDLAKSSSKDELFVALDSHIIDQAKLVGLYNRK